MKFIFNKLALAMTVISTVVIFVFSTQQGEVSYFYSGIGTHIFEYILERLGISIVDSSIVEYVLRKCAHVFLYGCLGISVSLLLRDLFRSFGKYYEVYTLMCSIIICTICGSIDEHIQSMSIGRGGKFADVYIDAIGYIGGIIAILVLCRIIEKNKEQNKNVKNE